MKYLFFALCIISLILPECNSNKKEKENKTVVLKKIPFKPPADSSIRVADMQKWLKCNPMLDSLSYLYLDSFKTDDAESRIRYQKNFAKAQDTICVKQGLFGGYEEYVWILKNSGNRRNKAVLDSLNLKTF